MLQNDYIHDTSSTPFRSFTICKADHVTFTSVSLKYTKFSLPPHISLPLPPPPTKGKTHKQKRKQAKKKTENSCTIICDTLNKICNVKKHVAAVQNVKENLPHELILFLSSNSSIPTKSSLLQQPERTYTASLLFAKLNVETEKTTANSIPYYAIQHEILTSSLPTQVCIRSEHRFAFLLKSCQKIWR